MFVALPPSLSYPEFAPTEHFSDLLTNPKSSRVSKASCRGPFVTLISADLMDGPVSTAPLIPSLPNRLETRDHLMITIPPGISVLAATISQASFLPLTLGVLDRCVLRPYEIHDLPTWVTVLTCLLSPLTAFSVRLLANDLIVYVKAKRAGAVLPPHSPTWVPGAIHRVLGTLKAEETAYLGNVPANSHL